MTEKCATCRFSEEHGIRTLNCRRYPPTVVAYTTNVDTVHPQVNQVHWCGEFQKRRPTDGNP